VSYKIEAMSVMTQTGTFRMQLRSWRQRRSLSQLELAIRAGTTQRHLSYLEQGRSVPSRTMVVRLAESLDLTLRDRNELLLSSGFAPVYPESDLDGPELLAVRSAIVAVLDAHDPYPAIAATPDGRLVAHNDATDVFFEGATPELLSPPLNGFRLALHPAGMAPRIRNFPEWGQHVLEALRGALRRRPDEAVAALLAELETYVPSAPPGVDHLGFAVPLRLATLDGDLTLITTLTSFATAIDVTVAELHLEAFLPADEHTADVLGQRAARRRSGGVSPAGAATGRSR
jgi:transcriptional regulator with XRE-family HTH domain